MQKLHHCLSSEVGPCLVVWLKLSQAEYFLPVGSLCWKTEAQRSVGQAACCKISATFIRGVMQKETEKVKMHTPKMF